MRKLLKYFLYAVIISFGIQTIAGLYLLIWDSDILGDTFARIWFTAAISSFFGLGILSCTEKI